MQNKKEDILLRYYIKDVSSYATLDDKEINALFEEIKHTKDEKTINKIKSKIITANLRLVIKNAIHYYENCNNSIPIMDLIEEGNMGLMRSVDLYKNNKNIKFSTYATKAILRTIRMAQSKEGIIRIPHNHQELSYKIKKIENENSNLNENNIAKNLQIKSKYLRLIRSGQKIKMLSLDDMVSSDNKNKFDIIESKDLNPEESLINKDLKEYFLKKIKSLKPIEKDIIIMVYFENEDSMPTVISERYKISKQRVHMIHKEALNKIKKAMKKDEKKEKINEKRSKNARSSKKR